MAETGPGEVTRLLHAWNGGDERARNEVVPVIYRELRKPTVAYLRRERPDHTLQPTALVHEPYLRLVDQTRLPAESHTHCDAIAANLMRQILVSHARRRKAVKRAGGKQVQLDEDAAVAPGMQLELVMLDESLQKLAEVDSRQGRIVELRLFGGLAEDEIAGVLGVTPATVKREWRVAKAHLRYEMGRSPWDAEGPP